MMLCSSPFNIVGDICEAAAMKSRWFVLKGLLFHKLMQQLIYHNITNNRLTKKPTNYPSMDLNFKISC